jgi:two-component system, chemotaxis family, CheB/CheR fusion protein
MVRTYTCTSVADQNISRGAAARRGMRLDGRSGPAPQELEDYLKIVLEDYEATTEELKATQEELTCANEELQTLNHELLLANDELRRLNRELRDSNSELEQSRLDTANMLRSARVGLVVVGSDLRVRRFSQAAEDLFHLQGADVGRPVREIAWPLETTELVSMCLRVMDNLQPQRHTISDRTGRARALVVRPHRTEEHRIDGVVLVILETP